jgi:hypothetical protein
MNDVLDQLAIDGRVNLHEPAEGYEKESAVVVSETLLRYAAITVGCHQYGTQISRELSRDRCSFTRACSVRKKETRVAVFIASPGFDMSEAGQLEQV